MAPSPVGAEERLRPPDDLVLPDEVPSSIGPKMDTPSMDSNLRCCNEPDLPNGCHALANNPHPTTSGGQHVFKGFGFAQCDHAIDTIQAKTRLRTQRWWGGWSWATSWQYSAQSSNDHYEGIGATTPCSSGQQGTFYTATVGYFWMTASQVYADAETDYSRNVRITCSA